MRPAYFVSGIHTDAGKTVASAVITMALGAEYWKPIQAGDLEFGDTDRIRSWTGLPEDHFHPVRHALRTPASPHYAARLDGVDITLRDFSLPAETTRGRALLVEGAGGLSVPINERQTITDLITHLQIPVILVSRHYLGSINHTLLSIAHLRKWGIPIAGLVYSGGNDGAQTRRIVESMTNLEPLLELPEFGELTPVTLGAYVEKFNVRERLESRLANL